MKYRKLGKTKYKVSEISLGAWAIVGTWGEVETANQSQLYIRLLIRA